MKTASFKHRHEAESFIRREGRDHCWAHEVLRIIEMGSGLFFIGRYGTDNRLVEWVRI